jgi:hypothetical protein
MTYETAHETCSMMGYNLISFDSTSKIPCLIDALQLDVKG